MLSPFLLFALNTASEFLIFIATIIVFVQSKDKALPRHRIYLLIIGASFLLIGGMGLAAYPGQPVNIDKISAAQTLFWYSLLSITVAEIAGINRLKYLLLLVLSAAVLLPLSPNSVLALDVLAEFLGALSFFTLFIMARHRLKYAGFFGLAGALAGIMTDIALGNPASANSLVFVRNAFIILGLANLVKFGPRFEEFINPPKVVWSAFEGREKLKEFLLPLVYLITYVSVLNIALMFATLSLHELGHFVAGSSMGCTGEIVLWNTFSPTPYTSMSCPPQTSATVLSAGGGLLVAPFGLVFFLLRRYPERNLGWIVYGLGISMSAFDISSVLGIKSIFYPAVILGAAMLCIGEALLINEYVSYSEKLFASLKQKKLPKAKSVPAAE